MGHQQLVLMVSVGLVLLACSRCGEARVRLNSIRTVILREGHPLPGNRSAWEPNVDLTVSACMFPSRVTSSTLLIKCVINKHGNTEVSKFY